MKIILLICLFISLFCGNINCQTVFASTIYYGRATTSGMYIYSSPNILEDKSNAIFEIPNSYFVQLLDDENELFYKATYNGVIGYIIKSEFKYIDKMPSTPFLTGKSFRVFTPSGANLRSSPNETYGATNLITTIPFMCTNLEFLGCCEGEEAISYKGNVWYYCKFIKENQEYYGYVYSPLCDMLSDFQPNLEEFNYISPNFKKVSELVEEENDFLKLSKAWQIVIIIAVSLPCLAIIYFLFKPTKIAMQKTTNSNLTKKQKKKKISRLKHSDYYELDSDYFN